MEISSVKHADQVKKSGQTLLRVYWKDCGACIQSQPDWQTVVDRVQNTLHPNCLVCQVESSNLDTLNSVLDTPLEVPSVPAYIHLIDGVRQPTEPERSIPSLLAFLRKHQFVGPKSRARGRSNKRRLGKPKSRKRTRRR